ncbi:MAG: TonB-dependent receptor [Gammaproteobacteria bacterium]|nr:TonB-dependent receptor [Gammaproteobacteria bacterium]
MHKSVYMTAALACSFISPIASATDEPKDNIVVSAYRTPELKSDIGSSVSIIERKPIEDRQIVFIEDALQDLPGVAVSRSGNYGAQTAVRIRGTEANHVLVRIDGIEVNDPAADDAFGFSLLTAYDIGNVEVIRGPQSAVWGSDAIGGVIDLRTRRATAPLEANGFVEGGAFDTFNSGIQVGSAGDKGSINFAGSYLNTDGTNISRQGSEDDGYENLTLNVNGDWKFSDALMLDATIRHTHATKEFDAIDFSVGGSGLPEDADRESKADQTLAGIGGSLSLYNDFWVQSLRGTYMGTENDNYVDGVKESKTEAEKYGAYYQSDFNITQGADEDFRQVITLAADFEHEKFKQRGIPSVFGDPNQDQTMDNLGLVTEYRGANLGKLSYSLGLRYDDYSDFDDIWTYRSTASYQFNDDSRAHGSYGTGQKSPTFTERFGFTPDQFQGNPDLKPEKSTGYDVGFEQSFLNKRVIADVTYFQSRLKDEINGFFFDPTIGAFGGFTAVNRDGKSRSKGVETSLSAIIADGLTTSASYTYNDAHEPATGGGQQRELRRPRHMAAVNVNYDFWDDRGQLNVNASYTGEQTDIFFPPENPPGTFPPSEIKSLDSYTLVNIAGSFDLTDRVTFTARVENLFDEDYENVYGFATPGIGAFAGIRVAFAD